MTRQRWIVRGALGALLATVLAVSLATTDTFSGFSTAVVNNSTASARSGQLGASHSYPSGTCSATTVTSTTTAACAGSVIPSTATSSTTDAITNTGTFLAGQVTSNLTISGCAPRKLANTSGTSDPFLSRGATAYNGPSAPGGKTSGFSSPVDNGGSVTFSASGDYASTAFTEAAATVDGNGGFGFWFKSRATAAGGLVSFDSTSQAPTGSGMNTLAVYLNAAGNLGLRRDANISIGQVSLNPTKYTDGVWHYVYVATATSTIVGGLATSINVYVDGGTTPVLQNALGGLLQPITTPASGYWFLGWSTEGYIGASGSTSISDFTTFGTNMSNNGSTLYAATTQTAYVSAATSADQLWPLNDPGTSVYTGSAAVLGGTQSDPCAAVSASFTSSGTAATPFVTTTGGPPTTAAVTISSSTWIAPSTPTTYTLAFSRNATYAPTVVAGLQIYAVATYTVSVGPWSIVFTWVPTSSALPTFTI